MALKKIIGDALVIGATLRLTRFIVSDTLGEWTLRGPAERWAEQVDVDAMNAELPRAKREELARKAQAGEPLTPASKLVSGLSCPFCVGFWIGLVVLGIDRLTARKPRTLIARTWRFIATALTLNYAAAHLASRID